MLGFQYPLQVWIFDPMQESCTCTDACCSYFYRHVYMRILLFLREIRTFFPEIFSAAESIYKVLVNLIELWIYIIASKCK
jgi:hypothetical protein